eukprot:Gb_02298 [translate_table: standard]
MFQCSPCHRTGHFKSKCLRIQNAGKDSRKERKRQSQEAGAKEKGIAEMPETESQRKCPSGLYPGRNARFPRYINIGTKTQSRQSQVSIPMADNQVTAQQYKPIKSHKRNMLSNQGLVQEVEKWKIVKGKKSRRYKSPVAELRVSESNNGPRKQSSQPTINTLLIHNNIQLATDPKLQNKEIELLLPSLSYYCPSKTYTCPDRTPDFTLVADRTDVLDVLASRTSIIYYCFKPYGCPCRPYIYHFKAHLAWELKGNCRKDQKGPCAFPTISITVRTDVIFELRIVLAWPCLDGIDVDFEGKGQKNLI